MKFRLLYFLFLFTIIFISGQKGIEKALKRQLLEGSNHYIDDPGVEISKEAFELNELNVSMLLADSLLKSNGYKTPTQSDFNKNIKLKLNRIIDSNSNRQYLYINFFDKCDRNFIYFPYNAVDYNGIYIDKGRKNVSKFYYIPELIDYQKSYPKVSNIEDQISSHYIKDGNNYSIELWKDLASRDDDKSQFAWLIANDVCFMESLVTTFGYTEDKKLLNWVMEKNYNNAEDFIVNNIFVKNCQGNLEIRESILKYIEDNTNNEEIKYANMLSSYAGNILNDNSTEFTKKERYKIIAYAANTFDYLSMKYKFLGLVSNARWNILGRYFSKPDQKDWKKMISEFKANNYYNLPYLQEVIEYAQQFDSVGAPD